MCQQKDIGTRQRTVVAEQIQLKYQVTLHFNATLGVAIKDWMVLF